MELRQRRNQASSTAGGVVTLPLARTSLILCREALPLQLSCSHGHRPGSDGGLWTLEPLGFFFFFFNHFFFSMSELLRLLLRESKDVKQTRKQNTFNICFLL